MIRCSIIASIAIAAVTVATVRCQESDRPKRRGDFSAKKAGGSEKRDGAAALFKRLDRDGNGKLSGDEVPERMRGRMEIIDTDGDGAISRSEFQRVAERMQGASKKFAGKGDPGQERPEGNGKPGESRSKGKAEKKSKFAKKGGDGRDPEELFSRMDRNGDGKLAKDELRGPLAENFDRLDANGDGFVTKDEIRNAMATFRRKQGDGKGPGKSRGPGPRGDRADSGTDRSPRALFNQQDVDADGRVTKSEAQGPLAEKFSQLDADKDGKLSLQEIETGMKSNADKPLPTKVRKK